MKIPIKKHTKVRRPMSRHITLLMDNTYNVPFDLRPTEKLLLVQDISKGLENPLTTDRLQRDINAFRKKYPPIWPERKPSLLTRVKERFKR